MLLAFLTAITLTMPEFYEDGSPLPSRPYVAVIYDADATPPFPVAADVGYPTEVISVSVPGDYGAWYAVAFEVESRLASAPSETVEKRAASGCYSCHL
jgi:hypothetical protein